MWKVQGKASVSYVKPVSEEKEVEEQKGKCDAYLKLYSAIIKNKIMYLQN